MKEELEQEQRIDETVQPFAGAPGVPGGTSNYMEEFPAEASNTSTTYNSKNAIWNSGTQTEGYRNISFAGSTGGLQFRADTSINTAPPGYPSNPNETKVFVRSKRQNLSSYRPWYELYHTGNNSMISSIPSIAAKADKTYVDSALALKADKSYVNTGFVTCDIGIALKADKTYVDNALTNKADKTTTNMLSQEMQTIRSRLSALENKK